MTPAVRDRQAQLDDHGSLEQRQVLHLVDDDAVELGEPFRQFAVPQPTDSRRRGGQLGKDADHRVGPDMFGHLEQRARRRAADAVVARPPVTVSGVAQPYQAAGRVGFRVQFARGLPRTTADDSCWHHTGRCAVSLRTATRSTAGASAPRAGRSATVCSERDGRQQSQLATGVRSTGGCGYGSGRIGVRAVPRCLARAPRRQAASVASLGRTPRSSDVDRVERLPVPAHHLVVLYVERIERCLEKLHEAGDAADVLRQATPLAADERRVVDIGLAIADRFDEDVGLQSSPKS